MKDLFWVLLLIVLMMGVYAYGEAMCYRRGGDVYDWAKWISDRLPKEWK